FLLQLRALLGGKFVGLAFLCSTARALAMILQERFAVVRTPTIGSSSDFHLQYTEIDAQLQFFATIEAGNFPYFNGAALVGPIVQNGVEIQTHRRKHPTFNVRLSITSRLGAIRREQTVAQNFY